jgi:hypothetical protein
MLPGEGTMQLTILFDAPYWIGLLEVEREHCLYVARYIFGAEPSDQLVYEFVQRDLLALLTSMTAGLPVDGAPAARRINPKRALREARRAVAPQGLATQSQEALRLQLEQNKQARETTSREALEAHKTH